MEISPEEKRRLIGVWIALLSTIAFAYANYQFSKVGLSLSLSNRTIILLPISFLMCIGVVVFGNLSAIWPIFTIFGLVCFQFFDFGLSFIQGFLLSLVWAGIGLVVFSGGLGGGGGGGGGRGKPVTLEDVKDLLEEIEEKIK